MKDFPREFDLAYDVKTMEQVERIANYEGDCSDAEPAELADLFQKLGMEVPACLTPHIGQSVPALKARIKALEYELSTIKSGEK